jgi:hypothetical protein
MKPLINDKDAPIDKGLQKSAHRKGFEQLSINYLLAIANEMFRTEHSTLQGGDRYG